MNQEVVYTTDFKVKKQNCKTRKKTWDKNTPNVAIKMTIGIYFQSSALSSF